MFSDVFFRFAKATFKVIYVINITLDLVIQFGC